MTTYALIPGAGGAGSYWHRVVPLLNAAGHEAIAIDLPASDERAGFDAYADVVLKAVGSRDVVLVAQSLGGFTAAAVAARKVVEAIVFVNAMIPLPGETAGAWWENTRWEEARIAAAKAGGYATEFDEKTYFFHDVSEEEVRALEKSGQEEAMSIFRDSCRLERWPDVPKKVIASRDDRFFPAEFQTRVARERLGVDTVSIPGGHLVALSYPRELVEALLG